MMAVLSVGQPAPRFSLPTIGFDQLRARTLSLEDYGGRWLMLFFYPRDFSFVCPTELTTFSARIEDFQQRECEILAVSADSIELHREWVSTPPDEGGLGPLQFLLGSDPTGAVARAYGVWMADKELSTRGMFLIDPAGLLQYAVIHNLSVGRTPDEVLRVLDALRTGGLCPASWTAADGTIDLESALEPGRILGHYRIRKRLGGGAFGSVFAAWDMRLERMVALKVLRQNLLESRAATVNEARAAARLNHPNVCSVYAVEEEDGLPVIVMEYVDGRTLIQEIAAGIPSRDSIDFGRQIAAGLAAAHQQQVVHGDLKPANIMITRERRAKILDFGLARSERAARASGTPAAQRPAESKRPTPQPVALENAGLAETLDRDVVASAAETAIRGTPAYMSPEQAMGCISASPSDVFSLGIVLCEMLTGEQPHGDRKAIEVVTHLQTADIASELAPRVAPEYRQLLAAMLQSDPAQRPSADTVRQELAAMLSRYSR